MALDITDFDILEELGRGAYGIVSMCMYRIEMICFIMCNQAVCARQISTNKRVALKFFGYLSQPDVRAIWREIELMIAMNGVTGVIQYIGTFNDSCEGVSEYKTSNIPTLLTCHCSHHPEQTI